jgi:hypothetical protein
VEVYRARSGHDVSIEFALIPFWIDTEEVIIYALVVYDNNDVVEAIDWDIYQQGKDELKAHFVDPDMVALLPKWRSVSLEASGYQFASFKTGSHPSPRGELLLAPLSARSRTLDASPPAGRCTLCLVPELNLKLGLSPRLAYYLDDELLVETPIFGHMLVVPNFIKILTSPGKHELKIRTPVKPSHFQREFSCEAGARYIAYPDFKTTQSETDTRNERYEGEIIVRETSLEALHGRRRLLFYNGKWMGVD